MRVKLWETEESEMVHTPPKELHTNQSIRVLFSFFFLTLPLDDPSITNVIVCEQVLASLGTRNVF